MRGSFRRVTSRIVVEKRRQGVEHLGCRTRVCSRKARPPSGRACTSVTDKRGYDQIETRERFVTGDGDVGDRYLDEGARIERRLRGYATARSKLEARRGGSVRFVARVSEAASASWLCVVLRVHGARSPLRAAHRARATAHIEGARRRARPERGPFAGRIGVLARARADSRGDLRHRTRSMYSKNDA